MGNRALSRAGMGPMGAAMLGAMAIVLGQVPTGMPMGSARPIVLRLVQKPPSGTIAPPIVVLIGVRIALWIALGIVLAIALDKGEAVLQNDRPIVPSKVPPNPRPKVLPNQHRNPGMIGLVAIDRWEIDPWEIDPVAIGLVEIDPWIAKIGIGNKHQSSPAIGGTTGTITLRAIGLLPRLPVLPALLLPRLSPQILLAPA